MLTKKEIMKMRRLLFGASLFSFLFFGCKKNTSTTNYWSVNGKVHNASHVYWIDQFGFVATDFDNNNILINFYSDSVSSGQYSVVNDSTSISSLPKTACTITGYLVNMAPFGSLGKTGDLINFSTPITKQTFTAIFNNITVKDTSNNIYFISGNLTLH
jgi:hypothetical protein